MRVPALSPTATSQHSRNSYGGTLLSKPITGRGGRPIKQKAEKRCIQINIRITIAEDHYYRQQADKAGLTVAEYLRRAGLNLAISVPRPMADAQLIREVNAIGVNINQIACAANRGQDQRDFWQTLADKVANTLDELVKRSA
jgi:hypothetical protein